MRRVLRCRALVAWFGCALSACSGDSLTPSANTGDASATVPRYDGDIVLPNGVECCAVTAFRGDCSGMGQVGGVRVGDYCPHMPDDAPVFTLDVDDAGCPIAIPTSDSCLIVSGTDSGSADAGDARSDLGDVDGTIDAVEADAAAMDAAGEGG